MTHILMVTALFFLSTSLISCSGSSTTAQPSGETTSVSKVGPPGIPTELTAFGADGRIRLKWTPPDGATSYNLYWSMTGSVTQASNRILNISMPFTHMDLANGTTYHYCVSAVNVYGESGLSAEVQAAPLAPYARILTKLTDPDAEVDEEFGWSVSMDGDYAVVGAPKSSRLDPSYYASSTGAAYVFHKANGVWDPAGYKLLAFDAQSGDSFGFSVSISGDYVIVGARHEDGGTDDPISNAGAAYIYHRTGDNTWDGGVKVVSPYPFQNSRFGNAVSISGDYAIVGQRSYNENIAYIFRRTDVNAWDSGTKIEVPGSVPGDLFGSALALSGDYAIVGAPGEDFISSVPLLDSGAAYIFHRTSVNTWEFVSKMMPFDVSAGANFGSTVALSGSYAAIGADRMNNNSGAVYIYHRLDEKFWDEGQKLVAMDAQESDNFGWSIGVTEQYVIVGAPFENCGWEEISNEGSAYLFKRISTNTWDSGTKVTISQGDTRDSFGYSVAISGEHAIISAIEDDSDNNGTPNVGAVYVY